MSQKVSSAEVKQILGRRVEIARRPEFLDSLVRPHLGAKAEANGNGWKTEVLQLDGTGAATLKIDLDGERVFAKFYPGSDHYPGDNGPLVFEKMKALRAAGFGSGERYQVVEPLGFIREYGILLTRGANGPAVSEFIGGDEEDLVAGAVEAARWLARFHTSPVRIGKPRSLLASSEVLSVARRLAKVMVRRPEHHDEAVGMIRQMEKLAEETVDGLLVQSHGQYRPIHVFLGDGAVTLIDMDRSRPCDPSFDVVEFLHRMRKTTLKYTGSVEPADEPTRAFIEACASEVPDRSYLANLRFHWARFVFHSLSNEMKDEDKDDPQSSPLTAYYRAEFENVIGGRFGI